MSDLTPGSESLFSDRRCAVEIDGRPGARDGRLRCIFVRDHTIPHRFMAPDATLRWWPVELGEPPAWDDAITTPATDPRWPDGNDRYGRAIDGLGSHPPLPRPPEDRPPCLGDAGHASLPGGVGVSDLTPEQLGDRVLKATALVTDEPIRCGADGALAALLSRLEAAALACNICGEPWPTHFEHCAYRMLQDECDVLSARLRTVEDALREHLADCAVTFADPRVKYIEVQMLADALERLAAALAGAESAAPEEGG